MRRSARGALLVFLSLTVYGCASSRPSKAPRTRTDLLTAEEIGGGRWANAYDVIQALRGRWLQSRGPDTLLGVPGEVQVRVDDVRMGGVSSLRNIPAMDITYAQFIDPTTAAARWGPGHAHGAIYVSTRPR
jgi:hypothetical protein